MHFLVAAQIVPGENDRIVGHRLKPHPLDRELFVDVGQIEQIAEDQFSFTPRIASIDDDVDIFLVQQPNQQLVARFATFDRLQLEPLRNGRQMLHAPRELLALGGQRHFQFDQMAHCGRNVGVVVLEVIFFLLKLPEFWHLRQNPRQVRSNAGLLRDDQSLARFLCHKATQFRVKLRSCLPVARQKTACFSVKTPFCRLLSISHPRRTS